MQRVWNIANACEPACCNRAGIVPSQRVFVVTVNGTPLCRVDVRPGMHISHFDGDVYIRTAARH